MSRALARAVGLAAQVLLLTSCFATSVSEKYFYDLTLPSAAWQGLGSQRIAVSPFSAAPGYSDDQIAYRVIGNELRYYGYRRWVAEPSKLLHLAVVRHLRASKRFGWVDIDEQAQHADGLLDGYVDAIEELDNGKQTRAHLAMSFVLRSNDGSQVLMRHSFDKEQVCERRHPQHVARGISAILAAQMPVLASRLAKALQRQAAR